ncbi:MAG: hypothetical protein JEZ14_24020 [Marinilabiliaceae bacterium]|nr:hypothetical protein [Marinilabiliaceae bacterium]
MYLVSKNLMKGKKEIAIQFGQSLDNDEFNLRKKQIDWRIIIKKLDDVIVNVQEEVIRDA